MLKRFVIAFGVEVGRYSGEQLTTALVATIAKLSSSSSPVEPSTEYSLNPDYFYPHPWKRNSTKQGQLASPSYPLTTTSWLWLAQQFQVGLKRCKLESWSTQQVQ